MEKNEEIFVDSNFFISLFNDLDSLHNKAKIIVERFVKSKPKIVISNFIFLETVTVLSQRVNRKTAYSAGEKLLNEEFCKIIHVDEGLQNVTWGIFHEVKKKNTSFVDCSILAVISYMGIKKLLTFDTEDFAGLRRKYSFSFYAK